MSAHDSGKHSLPNPQQPNPIHRQRNVSALLQEALDTPIEATSSSSSKPESSKSRLEQQVRVPAPPLAHIDQNQHPHHHTRTTSITTTRHTAEPEQLQPDTMPIVRPGRAPSFTRLLSRATPLASISRDAPALANARLDVRNHAATGHGDVFEMDEEELSPKRRGKLHAASSGASSRRLSDATIMQEEAIKLRRRSRYGQEDPRPGPPPSPSSNANNRNSLDGVRIGGRPFTSLVASNPFQKEANPFTSLISNDPFQKEPKPEPRPTARPRMRHRSSSASELETPPRHLQRTISSLLKVKDEQGGNVYPPESSYSLPRSASFASLAFPSHLSLPKTKLPNFPSFPNVPKAANFRNFSASARDDKSLWKTWWEGSAVLADGSERDEQARKHAHKHMLDDADKGDTLEEESEKIKQKYDTPKNPIVFCHGLLGFDYIGPKGLPAFQINHWRGICEVLQENGAELMIAKVPATSSAAQRAEILMAAIEEKFPGREVNLVAHSMGGLDGRYLISKLKPTKFKVISLTTIATPHRGSPFADYFIENIIGRERLPSWLSILDTISLGAAGDGSAFQALTTHSMELFNRQVPDDPNVKYYSWGASYEAGWFDPLRWSNEIIRAADGPNDGLVSVESSKWGEFRGVLVGCSHVDLVGWVNHVRFTMEAWAGRPIAFKPATFYLEIADHIAKQGF